MNVLNRKIIFRNIALQITSLKNVADEKAHYSVYCIGGDHRCSNCLGSSIDWHIHAYEGIDISIHEVMFTTPSFKFYLFVNLEGSILSKSNS
jgi:hypothetical protein